MAADPELAKLTREVKNLAASVKQYLKIFAALNENVVEIGRRLPKGDPVTQPIPPEFQSVVLPKTVPLVIYTKGQRIVVGEATVEDREEGMHVTAEIGDGAPPEIVDLFKTMPGELSLGFDFEPVRSAQDGEPLFELDPIPLREKSFLGEMPTVPEHLKNKPKWAPPEGFKLNIDLQEEA